MRKQFKLLSYYYLLFLFGTFVFTACQSGNSTIENQINEDILAKDANQLIQENINNKEFLILDTRTPGEYDIGHLQKALFIDYSSPSFKAVIEKLDRNKTYIIYCHSGGRSKATLKMMRKLGFKETYNLIGGIVAWSKSGYKIVK